MAQHFRYPCAWAVVLLQARAAQATFPIHLLLVTHLSTLFNVLTDPVLCSSPFLTSYIRAKPAFAPVPWLQAGNQFNIFINLLLVFILLFFSILYSSIISAATFFLAGWRWGFLAAGSVTHCQGLGWLLQMLYIFLLPSENLRLFSFNTDFQSKRNISLFSYKAMEWLYSLRLIPKNEINFQVRI